MSKKVEISRFKIFILSPDSNVPCGGIKQLYRHADILNDNGYEAYIVHEKNGFRCSWFENETPASCINKVEIKDEDYLVVPEIYGKFFCPNKRLSKHNIKTKEFICSSKRKVVFNQNCYFTFNGCSIDDSVNPFFSDDSIIATMVVSKDSKKYIQYAFPEMKVLRVHNAIDNKFFPYRDEKKKQICFMTRKLSEDVIQVINILKHRGHLQDFKLIPIEGMSEKKVSEIMQESLIFSSFSHQEGCQLPPMEAMSCGCLVIGYNGRGGREYFHSDFCYNVESRDIIGFASTIERVIDQYKNDPASIDEKRRLGSEYINRNYCPQIEVQDVLNCWEQIIAKSSSHPNSKVIVEAN